MQVKICGITHSDDAYFAADAGADYIGIIFSKSSKRYVSMVLAQEIAAVLKPQKTKLVAVFENASVKEILSTCSKINIDTIQLHGQLLDEDLETLRSVFSVFYAISAEKSDSMDLPEHIIPLYDSNKPGSGNTFDWQQLTPPSRPWVLAGGLNQDNVAHAIQLLNPTIVDVATGVEYDDNIRKNPTKITNFIRSAKQRSFL